MQVDVLLRRLGDIKVIDAPVLLKLYNMYRYKLHEWEITPLKYLNQTKLVSTGFPKKFFLNKNVCWRVADSRPQYFNSAKAFKNQALKVASLNSRYLGCF